MKKILYIIASAAVLFSACEKEQNILPALEGQNDLVTQSFTVSAPNTKTSLDGLEVIWSEGDEINVIEVDSQGNFIAERDFTLDSGAGSSSAVFVGEVASSDNTFYAIYPNVKLYEQPTIVNDETIVDIKKPNNDQTAEAVENGFDSSLAFMTAICDNNSFTFRHAVAFLKLIVKNDDIKSIRITVGGGARIFGRPSIVLSTGKPSAVNGTNASTNYITVSPKSGSFVNGSFYLVPITIKPNNSLGAVTLTATDQNGTNSILSATLNSLKPEAGIVYNIGAPEFSFDTTPTIELNKTVVEGITADGGTFSISNAYKLSFCSDSDVIVDCDGSIITAANISDGNINYTISENTGSGRSGWITLGLSDEDVQTVTVNQLAAGVESSIYWFYYDKSSSNNLVNTGSRFSTTGGGTVDCTGADDNFGVTGFDIEGLTCSRGFKLNSGASVSFIVTEGCTASISLYYAARKKSTSSPSIKVTKPNGDVYTNDSFNTFGTITYTELDNCTSGNYTIERGNGELGLFLIKVVETVE